MRSTILTSALLLLATSFVHSAPANDLQVRQQGCAEASRFGLLQVSPTTGLKQGDKINISYKQNCPDVQNIKPYALRVGLGANVGEDSHPYLLLNPGEPYSGEYEQLNFSVTIPDYYPAPFTNTSKSELFVELEYNQPGPKGQEATHLYIFSYPVSIARPANS